MPRVIQASWYDSPQYYDIAFQAETAREARFVEQACRKFCDFPVRRLLEPACGTGRLVERLAARGFHVTGLDLNRHALTYLKERLKRRGLKSSAKLGDMAKFTCSRPFDSAYCTLNSFRHLLTEDLAHQHLECMADAIRPGGLYILGFHLLPDDASLECIERWRERRGRTEVSVTLRVVASDRRKRIERLRVSSLVRDGGEVLRLRDEFDLRLYTAGQVRSLLKKSPRFVLRDVFDFWYDLRDPRPLDGALSDMVLVLQRR